MSVLLIRLPGITKTVKYGKKRVNITSPCVFLFVCFSRQFLCVALEPVLELALVD